VSVTCLRNPALSAVVLLLLSGCNPFAGTERLVSVPWAGSGSVLVADLHTHTTWSDGSDSVARLVGKAVDNGCQVLAITDHSDRNSKVHTADPGYFIAIDAERARHPGLVLIAGIEWNIPAYNGREHVSVLVAPPLAAAVLPEFRMRFDDTGRDKAESHPDPGGAMSWLQRQAESPRQAAFIYNHPSRKRETIEEARRDLLRWIDDSDLMVGFEGAPGHQNTNPNGSYQRKIHTLDRWDPLAAEVGGVWDQLLAKGIDVWGAVANSDYHNPGMDHPPCAFSRTHIQVPDRSPQGVLDALHAGSFWADHGRILNQFSLLLLHPDLQRPASPGETVRLADAADTRVALSLGRGPGAAGRPLSVELIGNCGDGQVRVLESAVLAPTQRSRLWRFDRLQPGADGRSCFFRARVRLVAEDGADLLAYSNPIRVLP